MDKHNETYKLKWVECKSNINYMAFREGEYAVCNVNPRIVRRTSTEPFRR